MKMIKEKKIIEDLRTIEKLTKQIKEELTKQNPQDDVLCNKCGETTKLHYSTNGSEPYGLINASVSGGYASYHLFDMTIYNFNLCEKCLRFMFINFKIPPQIRGYGADYNEHSFVEDQKQFEYREWSKNGLFHQAYMNGICNQIKDCPNKAVYTHLISGEFSEEASCEEHDQISIYGNVSLTKFIPHTLKSFF